MTPKERPILFSGDMVQAILAGRKTQTRRPIKKTASGRVQRGRKNWHIGDPDAILACPYQVGMRLWVRETWAPIPSLKPSGYFTDPKWLNRTAWYRADNDKPTWGGPWKPSIHMPRDACRFILRVTDVRVQRVQEISEEDAIAEGMKPRRWEPEDCLNDPRVQFEVLWDSTYSPGAWERNDWVWAIGFEVVK